MSLSVIQSEVGVWSAEQFGSQTSKVTHQVLGSLAPLLGMVEELGELNDAVMAVCFMQMEEDVDALEEDAADEAVEDALADIMVYTCDWAFREGDVDLVSLFDTASSIASGADSVGTDFFLEQTVSSIGRLCHITLKRHQAIRGYEDYGKYRTDRDAAIVVMLTSLICIAEETGIDLLDALTATWNKVKSRNWKARPVDANEHEVV